MCECVSERVSVGVCMCDGGREEECSTVEDFLLLWCIACCDSCLLYTLFC